LVIELFLSMTQTTFLFHTKDKMLIDRMQRHVVIEHGKNTQ